MSPVKNIHKIEVDDMDGSDVAYSSGSRPKKKARKPYKGAEIDPVPVRSKEKEVEAVKAPHKAGAGSILRSSEPVSEALGAEKDPAPATAAIGKSTSRKTKLVPFDVESRLNSPAGAVKDLISKEKDLQEKDLESAGERIQVRRSISTYRKIAFFFISLTGILILAITYLTMVSVKIILVPEQERSSGNMIFDVKDGGSPAGSGLNGAVKKIPVSKTAQYPVSGQEVIGREAVGTVTIYNNYNKNQPLVATTRLVPVSDPDKLYRIRNTVNVPAGGSMEVEIYADVPSPEMAIEASRFAIPGLWAGLQDKIYAESSASVVYQQKVEKFLTQDDVDNAIKEMKQLMIATARDGYKTADQAFDKQIYRIDEASVKHSYTGSIREKMETLDISMSADVVLVAFGEKEAADLAEQKFSSSLPADKAAISFDKSSIIYALSGFDHEEGSATVNASFEGRISLNENMGVVEVDKILGLNQEQLNNYLKGISGLAGYETVFSPKFLPGFLKRVPPLRDKVKIEMNR